MLEIKNEPAQTYQFNVLASVLGRCAIPNLDDETSNQLSIMLESAVDDIRVSKQPAVPHTNKALLGEAIIFDNKLQWLLNRPAAQFLPNLAVQEASKLVETHMQTCIDIRQKTPKTEFFIHPKSIASSYGLTDLWDNPHALIENEADRWSSYSNHPEIPEDLSRQVRLESTRDLMMVMWQHIAGAKTAPDTQIYLTDRPENYHLYWSPIATTLDYATPTNYDAATQLSFDLPHNATHLYHLDAMTPDLGVFKYNDNMSQRSYFEAVAVLSEYLAIDHAKNNKSFRESLHSALQPTAMTAEETAEWLIADRGYEFKLRAARYAADVLMLEGASFEDTAQEIADSFKIPLTAAQNETKKYLPWTGLGAVYSFGYRKLDELNIHNVHDAVFGANGAAINTWEERLNQTYGY